MGVMIAGVLLMVALAAVRGTSLAFTLGVPVNGVVVEVKPGDEFCQVEVTGPDGGVPVDAVRIILGTYGQPGPTLDLRVEDERGGVIGRGVLPPAYPDITEERGQTIRLSAGLESRERMAFCFRNAGVRKVAFYGAGDGASVPTTGELDGRATGADVSLEVLGERRSYLASLGDILARARLFRAGPLLPGYVYLGGLLLLFAASAGLLASAVSASRPGTDDVSPDTDGSSA